MTTLILYGYTQLLADAWWYEYEPKPTLNELYFKAYFQHASKTKTGKVGPGNMHMKAVTAGGAVFHKSL
jgi:hypothetical protein